jgi:hypothetical protein
MRRRLHIRAVHGHHGVKEKGEAALALAKCPPERFILLLAVHLHLSPGEINQLNLAQVTQKLGRDGQARVYLKNRLVRKRVLAESLLQYRKRGPDPALRRAGVEEHARHREHPRAISPIGATTDVLGHRYPVPTRPEPLISVPQQLCLLASVSEREPESGAVGEPPQLGP